MAHLQQRATAGMGYFEEKFQPPNENKAENEDDNDDNNDDDNGYDAFFVVVFIVILIVFAVGQGLYQPSCFWKLWHLHDF
jgi:hypothetical protein